MRCEICGLEYGLTHNCPGPIASPESGVEVPPPSGFAPLYYLKHAWSIARWDESAIRRAARDPRCLGYGAALYLLTFVPLFVLGFVGLSASSPVLRLQFVIGMVILLVIALIIQIAQWGLCFSIARYVLGGHGRFMEIVRASLMGSIPLVLVVVPYIGVIVAGFWFLAILMLIFEEVMGIRRMQAFFLIFGTGLLFRGLEFLLFSGLSGTGG